MEVEPFDRDLRSPCAFTTSVPGTRKFYIMAAYLGFARSILVLVVAITTITHRYRKHNSLIKVIRREGGMYYVSATIPQTSNLELRELLIPIFAQCLLLKMQRVNDPGTEAFLTTLMFENTGGASTSDTESADVRWVEADEKQNGNSLRDKSVEFHDNGIALVTRSREDGFGGRSV
ncbi:hypothetical protein DFP72DRAFT_857365 [Ephemerocybe angulata]|uniref:Uncharacterized protein n=1 Tax=Ephemerocybe angulata TaxID=980116 RepID=A0A8H6LXT6_9AGAR|nr:hypothetical protein DFP72DRAFT_857365 [Tulosesus angulatus]